jgi:hypothetical protein
LIEKPSLSRLRSKRLFVSVLVCVLAAIGGATAFALSRGSGASAVLPTTGQYAPLTVHRQHIVLLGGAVVNDPDPSEQSYMSATLYHLSDARHFRLVVTNTSNIGAITAFQWYPPIGFDIQRLSEDDSGHCKASGLTGFGGSQFKTVVLYPNVLCTNLDMKAPSCACSGDGGSVTLSFYLNKDTEQSGEVRLVAATPSLKPIPSSLGDP